MMNSYQTNPYLNMAALDQGLLEVQKAQERQAILCILNAKKAKIKARHVKVTAQLKAQKTKMSEFAAKTVTANFKAGLTGKAAQAAEQLLISNKFDPNLQSPIK